MNLKCKVRLVTALCVMMAATLSCAIPTVILAQEEYTEVTTGPRGTIPAGSDSLNYGFGSSETLRMGTIPSVQIQLSKPNVYLISNNWVIDHIWGANSSSSNFLLGLMKDDSGTNYDIFSSPGFGGRLFVTRKADGSVNRIKGVVEKEIPNYGKVEFTAEQYPSGAHGIMHSVTIKNTGDKPLKFVYMKSVDTDLAGNDSVPVRMYGQNKGLYIENDNYRLVYDFTTPHAPHNFRNWYNGLYRHPLKDGFENSMNIPFFPSNNLLAPGDESKNYAPDAKVEGRGDTGIWMKWKPVTLNPGESATFDYIVRLFERTGSQLSAFNDTKQADAQGNTRNDNRDNITISARVDVVTKFQHLFTDGTTTFSLKHTNADGSLRNDELKLGNTISLVNSLGEVKKTLPLSDVYDPATKQLTVSYAKADFPNGVAEIKFTVLPDEKYAEQERYLSIDASAATNFSDGFVARTTNNLKLKLNALVLPKVMTAAPTLNVQNKTIQQGEKLELLSLVTSAMDYENKDLSSEVKVVDDGGFKNDVVGRYTVTFKVTDKLGASATKKALVTVNPKMATLNTAPVLKVQDTTITKGDTLDLTSLIVTATDQEDGDLKSSVQIIKPSGFDTTQVGEYVLTFRLVDKNGATTTKTAKLTVKEAPPAPKIPQTPTQPANPSAPAITPNAPAKVSPQNTAQAQPKVSVLPKTGDAASVAAVLGIGALGAAILAMARKFKKHQ